MSSYRLARRSFLAGLGGAFGLEILLGNLEAMAEVAASPPRFLLMHLPLRTVLHHLLPVGSRTNFTLSRILHPFAPLKDDAIILYGLVDPGSLELCGGAME